MARLRAQMWDLEHDRYEPTASCARWFALGSVRRLMHQCGEKNQDNACRLRKQKIFCATLLLS